MSEKEKLDVIIYRVRDNGLEVFLVDRDQHEIEKGGFTTPNSVDGKSYRIPENSIQLDKVTDELGNTRTAIAIEADWHDIPSLRALMYEDYRVAKEKAKQHLKNFLPDLEKGTYVAVKEAFKKVLPHEYNAIKELKEILFDRNSVKNM